MGFDLPTIGITRTRTSWSDRQTVPNTGNDQVSKEFTFAKVEKNGAALGGLPDGESDYKRYDVGTVF